jgi:hypothetical protein
VDDSGTRSLVSGHTGHPCVKNQVCDCAGPTGDDEAGQEVKPRFLPCLCLPGTLLYCTMFEWHEGSGLNKARNTGQEL